MNGCPVLAYEKDPVTGIVRHLDDQCIGCQYCTFMCPYDVPQYNGARGIVRKCDMCQDRLAVGEAPACVQACPNEAIAISIVDRQSVLETTEADAFVPGAPSPAITVPTTVYKTERALPRNLLPVNFYAIKPSHHHAPLVVMLVLTQLSAGAFCVDAIGSPLVAEEVKSALGRVHSLVAVAVGLAALGASILHLGRPLYAFRALLGLRTSWMSREILSFGLFALLAMLYAASFWATPLAYARDSLRIGAAVMGAAGVACSVLIYQATRRAWWSASATAFKFVLTAAILGLATAWLTLSIVGRTLSAGTLSTVASAVARLLVAACVLKIVGELLVLRHMKGHRQSELKRSALLLVRDLRGYTMARGGLMIAAIIAAAYGLAHPLSIPAAATIMALLVAGELVERTLFFAALSSPGMPGNLT
jgi:DMSO reductase anchor subunit/ferredoxin